MTLISFSGEIKDLKTNNSISYYSVNGLECREEMYKNIFINGRI